MSNFNISTLFGSFGSSKSGLESINLSDYALIKSGSYKKLMKSYYGQNKTTSTSQSATDNSKDKKRYDVTDKTGLTKMKTEAEGLKSSVAALDDKDVFKQTNGNYNVDKIVSAVKQFANDYNDVIAQADKVDTKDVTRQVGFMTSMTKTMSKALSKVGVTVGEDGKLSVNEESLRQADVKSVKSLFSGSYSYASQIGQNAGAVASAAARNSSLYSSDGLYANLPQSKYNEWI